MNPTPRQLEILRAIIDGHTTNEQIAQKLDVAVATIKHHFTMLFDQTGMGSKLELVLHALRKGWVEL